MMGGGKVLQRIEKIGRSWGAEDGRGLHLALRGGSGN